MLSVLNALYTKIEGDNESPIKFGRIRNLNYFQNISIDRDDYLRFAYQVLSRFDINYLSFSHITAFETKLYEWVYKYIVGGKLPTSIKMLRGVVIEKCLLGKIKFFDDKEKLASDAVIEFRKLLDENLNNKNDILPYTEEEYEDTISFIQNAIRLNFEFFKERTFINQGAGIRYRLKDSVNIYGIIDAIIERKEFNGILELKTTDRIPKEPYELHIRQLSFYLLATGLPYGYIYYVGSGGKTLKKGATYFRAFVFEREKVLDYIVEYIETMVFKMVSFLSKFNSPTEIINSVVPQYTDFFFNQELREQFGNIFGLKQEKPKFASTIDLSV